MVDQAADGNARTLVITAHLPAQLSSAPDGRFYIAFIAFDGTGRMGIWVAAADGTGAHALRVAPGSKTLLHFPVYSPDGRSLAFVLQGAWMQIAVIRADGGGQRVVSPRTRFIAGVDWARA